MVAEAIKRRRKELSLPDNPEDDIDPFIPPHRELIRDDNMTPIAAPFLGPYR
jgi:hypothetical protein